jgi:tRNA (uracil-5-)-methyltransferase TRM9
MKPEIAREIVDLNHQFYQSFAGDFSETRGRLQMGVRKVLERIPKTCSFLDLGCGNGNVLMQLAENGFQGSYLGVDFSLGLLDWACRDKPTGFQIEFRELDLTSPSWTGTLPAKGFEVICCFATLHHIPSQELRISICRNIRKHQADGGLFYLSTWQFNKSERLNKKIQPWETIGLKDDQVDEGDYLLDWRRGGTGTRYIHLFSVEELQDLAELSDFRVIETFDSDGEGGNLGLYQVWEPL